MHRNVRRSLLALGITLIVLPAAISDGHQLHPAPGAGRPSRPLTQAIPCRGMAPIPINIADWVGRTPMVQLTRLAARRAGVAVRQARDAQPGGSVKDRIGVAMIEAAEAEGRIEPGRTTIVEATSGNTGIALAFVCAAKGYDLILTLPQGMSREREGLLRLYGAQFQITESLGGMNEAVAAAQALARDDGFWLPDQFSNPANPDAHYRGTGPELWETLDGDIDVPRGRHRHRRHDHRRRPLPEGAQPEAAVVGVEPAASPVISGGRPGPHKIQGIGAGFVPPVLDRDLLDEVIAIDDEDALETARVVARREGVLAGISAGAALAGAIQVAEREARADRGRAAGLRRALRLDAVLRPGARRGGAPVTLRETSGSAGAPWERPLRGTLDRLVVESERLAGNPLGDPATRPLWVYSRARRRRRAGAHHLRDPGLPRPGRLVGQSLPVRAHDARAGRRDVRHRRLPAGAGGVRRRVDELRRLAVPQLVEHRPVPRLPVRRGRAVRR